MNEQSPRMEGSAGSQGRDLPSVHHDRDGDLRWELKGRMNAIVLELDVQPMDLDVIETLLLGAVESIENAT